jgi:hypothetical protein
MPPRQPASGAGAGGKKPYPDIRGAGQCALDLISRPGDCNADGKSDLLWRDSSGNTSMWFLNGATVALTVGLEPRAFHDLRRDAQSTEAAAMLALQRGGAYRTDLPAAAGATTKAGLAACLPVDMTSFLLLLGAPVAGREPYGRPHRPSNTACEVISPYISHYVWRVSDLTAMINSDGCYRVAGGLFDDAARQASPVARFCTS